MKRCKYLIINEVLDLASPLLYLNQFFIFFPALSGEAGMASRDGELETRKKRQWVQTSNFSETIKNGKVQFRL